jgi:hypothetical protein
MSLVIVSEFTDFLMKMLSAIFEEWGVGENFSLDYLNFHLEKIISKKYALLPNVKATHRRF